MVACLETNATGNFLRRNRHGYLGSSCHAVRFLIVSRDHIVRERFCLCDGHSLLRPRWDNIRRWSNNRDYRCLRSRSCTNCFIRAHGRVRSPAVWGEGHMQEMWAWVRLQLILLPLLWAKAGLKRAGRVFRKRFRASLSFRPFPTRGSRYETRRVVLIGP